MEELAAGKRHGLNPRVYRWLKEYETKIREYLETPTGIHWSQRSRIQILKPKSTT